METQVVNANEIMQVISARNVNGLSEISNRLLTEYFCQPGQNLIYFYIL